MGYPSDIKGRIIKADPVLGELIAKQNLIGETVIAGGAAGDLTVAAIRKGDNLVSVINLTDGTDETDEFTITDDGVINNTGGTATTGDVLKVLWEQWIIR